MYDFSDFKPRINIVMNEKSVLVTGSPPYFGCGGTISLTYSVYNGLVI